ncbi:MAG: site-specific DNA-methyltransferase [Helicobacteraceae bacterium]|jgi:DNA modification methylase|nr:site-specific DNA-methyltransferase [Helicobacteraceae bacterium]
MNTDYSDLGNAVQKDINVDSLWIINERSKYGKHSNVYHGNFIPQIPNQLIRRYTKKGETVLDIFMGSGTTLYECENLERNFIGYDINNQIIDFVKSKMTDTQSIKFEINCADVTNKEDFDATMLNALQKLNIDKVDFLIAHPPYMDIVKFTDQAEDLSRISDLKIFLEKFMAAIGNGLNYLKKDRYFAIIIGDIYKKSEVIPLGFYASDAIKKSFAVKLKGVIIKNIEGNRGKLGAYNIWKYRALKSDYYIFKHEYIFVFKKEF